MKNEGVFFTWEVPTEVLVCVWILREVFLLKMPGQKARI